MSKLRVEKAARSFVESTVASYGAESALSRARRIVHEYPTGRVPQWLTRAIVLLEARYECSHCAAFFARFRCSAATHGECDCPRCQGYCTCNERTHE
jgi:hypothetical protein